MKQLKTITSQKQEEMKKKKRKKKEKRKKKRDDNRNTTTITSSNTNNITLFTHSAKPSSPTCPLTSFPQYPCGPPISLSV